MTIQETLKQSEEQNSIFENAIRQINIPVSQVFKKNDVIQPVSFEHTSIKLETPDSEQVNKSFANSYDQSKNMVLKGVVLDTELKSGLKVAVLFSGGPASGGHNVIAGLKKVLGTMISPNTARALWVLLCSGLHGSIEKVNMLAQDGMNIKMKGENL